MDHVTVINVVIEFVHQRARRRVQRQWWQDKHHNNQLTQAKASSVPALQTDVTIQLKEVDFHWTHK